MKTQMFALGTAAFLMACSQAKPATSSALADSANGTSSAVIPPPAVVVPPPHLDVTDAGKIAPVMTALNGIMTAQNQTIQPSYQISSLSCMLLTVPFEPQAYSCDLTYLAGGTTSTVVQEQDTDASALAQTLFNALQGAGATYDNDPHYFRTSLTNVSLSATDLSFDDESTWTAPEKQNVQVTGDAASQVLSAIGALGLDDSDRSLFLICSHYQATPSCGYQLHQQASGDLDAATSASLWAALVQASAAAGYQPLNGTLDGMTIINAGDFSFDGTTLGFVMEGDNATPPPPPTPGPQG